ncbi:MAG: MFS transporter [Bacteroidia bacterium]
MSKIQKDDKRVIRAWTFYDWANSSFPLVINSAIFPTFYEFQTTVRDENTHVVISDMVNVFGMQMKNSVLYSFVVSLSLIIVCITAPILSGIADYSGSKKNFLSIFCIMGSVACAGLFFFSKDNVVLSMFPFLVATVGYWGSIVFYNAYLPEIASTENQDRVSAKGFALGYFGSSLLLILNLVMIMVFHIPAAWCFVTVSLWWFGFAQITLRALPDTRTNKKMEGNRLTIGFREISKVWSELKQIKRLKRFLASYFFYNMGVQTVMYMAVLFAAKEIHWPDESTKSTSLIVSILLIQFLGMAGSYLFSYLSGKIGNLKSLGISVFFWAIVCVGVYWFVTEPIHFYITAACVGLVMGGTQSLSRSTYSKLLPETQDHASYFSFFDVLEKIGIVLGTLSFGIIEEITGGMRNSVLALVAFFVIGFVLLLAMPKTKEIS